MSLRKLYTGLCCAIVAIGMIGCGAPSQGGQPTTQSSYPPLNILTMSDRFVATSPEMLCQATLVAFVTVRTHIPSQWNSADGKRPPIANANTIISQGYWIQTPLLFSQFTPWLDHRQHATKAFVSYGGQVGQDQFWSNGHAQVKDQHTYVAAFFTSAIPNSNGKRNPEIMSLIDAFRVDSNGMIIIQEAGHPDEPGVGAVQEQLTMSVNEFRQRLATCP